MSAQNQPAPAPKVSKQNQNPSFTECALVVLGMGTLGLMGVPSKAPTQAQVLEAQAANKLVLRLEEFRTGIFNYRETHAVYPGYAAGRPGYQLHGELSPSWFTRQLTLYTNVWGESAGPGLSSHSLRPVLDYGIPTNPVNGLQEVWLIADGEAFPADPNDQSGWIYQAASGMLRANCSGTVPGTQIRYFDL